jgi:hypothetical protein
MANYIRSLSLTLDPDEGGGTPKNVECQGTNIALIPSMEGGETITTFCGAVEIPGVTKHTLHIEGLQDWEMVDSLCDIIHDAWKMGADNDPDTSDLISYVLTVGSATRTGQVRPATDLEFGGGAGSALTFTVDLPCTGTPTDGVVAP